MYLQICNDQGQYSGYETHGNSWRQSGRSHTDVMPYIPPVLARREISTNRFLSYIEEDIGDPTGRAYTYYQVESIWDGVIIVPVLSDGRLVLERIYRHPYRRDFLEFPAGGINHGESPLAAAARELEEETGYRVSTLRLLGAYEALPGLLRMRMHVVLAEGLTQTGTRQHETMELIEVVEMTEAAAWAEADREVPSSLLSVGLLHLLRDRRHQHA